MLSRLAELRSDESGVVYVLFLVLTGAMIVMFGFVINVGNWFEHRRHLRTQVDASVFATALDFTFCGYAPDQANDAIEASARRYAGADPGTFNPQIGDAEVDIALNATGYPPSSADFGTGEPCDFPASLDVKAMDSEIATILPGVFEDVGLIDVKARAKLEIRRLEQMKRMVPWSVPEFDPRTVAALVVNEQTGALISSHSLVKGSAADVNGETVTMWEADGQPTVAARTGIIIVASRLESPTLSGSVASICAQARTTCYAGAGATSGLAFIRGFPNSIPPGTASNPQLLDVELLSPSCSDASAPYFVNSANCVVTVRARIDFGTGNADPTNAPTNAQVELDGLPMTWQAGWFRRDITVGPGDGRVGPWDLDWATDDGGLENGTFTDAAHPYGADADSGPVKYFSVTGLGGVEDHTFTTGSQPLLHFAVGVEPTLRVAAPGDPPVVLDVTGNREQVVNCDQLTTTQTETENGCRTPYRVNTRDGDCAGFTTGNLPPATFTPTPPPDCMEIITTGFAAFRNGLDARFETPCTPNDWPTDAANDPLPEPGDPRLVVVAVTDPAPPGATQPRVAPVVKLAGFYVTGWDADTCSDNDAYPGPGNDDGKVWGHFITSVNSVSGAPETSDPCNFGQLGICMAVLTD